MPCPTFAAQVVLLDDELRRQLLRAFTEDDRLHVDEVARLLRLVQVRGGGRERLAAEAAAFLCRRLHPQPCLRRAPRS